MNVNPKVGKRLNDIMLTAMNRDIEGYTTASELLEAIENYTIDGRIRTILNDCHLNHPDKIDSLRSLSATYPRNSRVHLNIGEFYNRIGYYQEAIEVFKEGIELNP